MPERVVLNLYVRSRKLWLLEFVEIAHGAGVFSVMCWLRVVATRTRVVFDGRRAGSSIRGGLRVLSSPVGRALLLLLATALRGSANCRAR